GRALQARAAGAGAGERAGVHVVALGAVVARRLHALVGRDVAAGDVARIARRAVRGGALADAAVTAVVRGAELAIVASAELVRRPLHAGAVHAGADVALVPERGAVRRARANPGDAPDG